MMDDDSKQSRKIKKDGKIIILPPVGSGDMWYGSGRWTR